MAKIKINKLPAGFKLDNGKVVEDKFMRNGGDLSTGDQADYGLVTTPQNFYGNENNTAFNNTDDKDVRYSISSVPRDNANIEAEGGETVLTDLTNDGTFGLYDIKGPRHSSGGVPMFLPEQSFIYSDTNKMKFTKDELAEFGISTKKKMTPAKLSKKYELNDHYAHLESPYADVIQSTTAELMLKKNMMNLSKVAFAQESKKKFEEGVPLAAHPYLVQQGIDPIEFTAQMEEISKEQAQMNAIAALPPEQQEQLMMLQEMMAQMEQQGQQQGQQQQQQPMQGEQQMNQEMAMQEQAMARFGGERTLRKAQRGNEKGSEYATRKGQSWPEGVEDPTYDETNEVWVFESGAPSLTRSEAMEMAIAAKNGAPVPEVYQIQSVQTTDETTVVDDEVITETSTGDGNPGIDPAKWEIWKEKLDAGNHELSTTTDANGLTTVTITETRDAPRVKTEKRQAENLVGSDEKINITDQDSADQDRAFGENDDYFNDTGLFSDGTRGRSQGLTEADGNTYGSEDIQTPEARADLERRWGPQMDQYETDSGNEWDWDMPKKQVLALQRNMEAQRELDAAAAGVTYVPWFREDGKDGRGFDGKYGLNTFNTPKLTKREYFSDSASYQEPKIPPLIPPLIPPPLIPPLIPPPAEPWLQDLMGEATLSGAFDNLYLPWAPDAERIQLNPVFDDWRGAVNANNAAASTMAQAVGAVGGPQAVANSLIQGQAMDANAKAQNRVNSNNVNTANQYGAMQAQYDMAINAENAKRQTDVYDNTQKTLQQHDNFLNWKNAKRGELAINKVTNAANTFALNQTYDHFAIDPSTGGMPYFTNPNALDESGLPLTQEASDQALYKVMADFRRENPNATDGDMEWFLKNRVIIDSNNKRSQGRQELYDNRQNIGYPTGRKGKETKRMAVPFYTGKMGG
jgi:hypothetical protein